MMIERGNLTCEGYRNNPDLQKMLEQQARRERAAAMDACLAAAAASLRRLLKPVMRRDKRAQDAAGYFSFGTRPIR